VAVTVKVYVVPFVRPVIVIGEPPLVAVNPPTLDVTVYEVIDDPPVLTGGVNVIVAWPFPATALTPVGASGTVFGVTELLDAEAVLVPIAFVAVTVKVYAWPLTRPVIVIGEPPLVAVNPPTLDVTVYEVIDAYPSLDGGVKVMVASPLPATALTPVGASGTVAGEIEFEAVEGVLVPYAFVAVTVNVYAWPLESPVTMSGEDGPKVVTFPTFEVTV